MTQRDAAKILGLDGAATPDRTRTAYREACRRYHPDVNPAGDEMMRLVNAAFEALEDFAGDLGSQDKGSDYGDAVNGALGVVVRLVGLDIELCGAWVWVSGDTKQHRETLKAAGFRWAPKKRLWYFRPADYRSRSRGGVSMNDIRATYGSIRPDALERREVTA